MKERRKEGIQHFKYNDKTSLPDFQIFDIDYGDNSF